MYRGKYYLGLDMGTNSVGWAVTDSSYHLLRAKGKDLWGARLFQEANTAADRRSHRTQRRRLAREKQRISILNDLFANEINKVDPGFFQRLQDSKFFEEDKKEAQPFTLFADSHYTDKNFHKDYPTVYHLRQAFLHGEVPSDVRLLYLAIHSLYKNRGNFLNANISAGDLQKIAPLYKELRDNSSNLSGSAGAVFPDLDEKELNQFQIILSSDKYSPSVKQEKIDELLRINKKDKNQIQWIKLICGMKGKISVAFPHEADDYDEEGKKFSLSFRDGNFDEELQKAEEILHPEEFDFLMSLKKVHDSGLLLDIMDGEEFLSDARVKGYENHQKDLKKLKNAYKQFCPENYNRMFRSMEKGFNNYSAYVGSVNHKRPIRRKSKCSVEDLYKTIKADLSDYKDERDVSEIFEKIENGTFLLKQRTSDNGVIPYQVHQKELKAILKNAEGKYPFLLKKDASGFSVAQKIEKTFAFRIPYYVGPLYNDGKHTAWSVRNSNGHGKVYPWNFDKKIDKKASAEKFMEELIGHCTYLNDEKVLPKQSILYEKFCCLNELNNLKIDGRKPTPEVKQKIFTDLFLTGRKVTAKRLKQYLINQDYANGIKTPDELVISGVDGDFQHTMASYHHFCEVLKTNHLSCSQEKMAEDIIEWSTVYGDSKKFLEERIREVYSEEQLSEKQLKRILGIKFRDWGKLSKEFLYLEGTDRETGEILPLIRRMEVSNDNLMELLSSKYTYAEEIERRTKNHELTIETISHEDLDGMYLSAPVKRMVWQTILIIREVIKMMGHEPDRIFVEMTRGEGEKKRTTSRKRKFEELYKNIRDDSVNWSKELENRTEADFRNKKLYLYFSQMGRSMYTGKPIDLDKLLTSNTDYDLDHIYPRHYVKDDSLDNNLVLVEKQLNAHKTDVYPLENSIRENPEVQSLWRMLLNKGLITQTKYYRLMRSSEFSDDERAEFISRQIVETSQATKTVTHLIEELLPDQTKVIYSKAGNISDFRNKYHIYKAREVNDFHHANDAYLNIVVGNTYYTKFTSNPRNFIKDWRKDRKKNEYTLGALFDKPVERDGVMAWNSEHGESIRVVKNVLKKQTPLVTFMNYTGKGAIADQTLYSAEKAKQSKSDGAYLPLKTSDPRMINVSRYGGFTKLSTAYFFLVEHMLKGKKVRTVECVPVCKEPQIKTKDDLEKFCREDLHLIDPVVRVKKIKLYSKLRINGFDLYLTGRTGNQLVVVNAEELKLNNEQIHYVKKLGKVQQQKWSEDQIMKDADRISKKENQNHEIAITRDKNLELYQILEQKHAEGIFAKRPNPVGSKLKDKEGSFIKLDLDEQVSVLNEILKLSERINGANLKEIGLSANTGNSKINKQVSGLRQCDLISQSITGLYENKTDLLTV